MSGPDEGEPVDRPGSLLPFEPGEFPPPSATVDVTFGAHSRRGRMHAVNEDHYLVMRLGRHQETMMTSLPEKVIAARFDEYGYAMIVADGVGATGEGEAASHLAIATLVYLVRHFGKWSLRVDDLVAQELIARVERFYRHVDSTVRYRRDTAVPQPDQTTLTAVFGAGHDLFFAHVGHSRAYLCRDGQLMRLTRDHTLGGRRSSAIATAPLMDVSVSARDLAHILTDTIGMRGSVGPTIDIERFHLCDDDRVLVCTNGLTDQVDEASMEEVLASARSADEQSRSLVDQAMTAGGDDDITALVARYRIPG
jgi:serine/threonine protein phosphatase PrpC